MILVTGGAGYIGSHCVLSLLRYGYDVAIFDNLSTGHNEFVDKLSLLGNVTFVKGDLLNKNEILKLFEKNKISAVIHFAAFSQVSESVHDPQKYYFNNLVGSLNLFEAMLEYKILRLVFSSSAAVYGEPQYLPIDENHITEPVNPYGKTKLFIEKILEDYDKAYGLKSIKLRYFNVAGSGFENIIGEWHNPETHLIPNILKSVLGNGRVFKIYGDKYKTVDGTCVRDYINIEDLIQAHILALRYLEINSTSDCFNLGTNRGNSVKEVFQTCEAVTNERIVTEMSGQREGDPASLIANNEKAEQILGWKPKKDLYETIKSAYNWEKELSKINGSN